MSVCQTHDLIRVMQCRNPNAPNAFSVVRWCKCCGAIVIDADVDGRTLPGEIMPMRFASSTVKPYP